MGKNKPKLHLFQFSTRYREFFRVNNRFIGVSQFKYAISISREQRELPWQPNLGKNKSKLHLFQFCKNIETLFACKVGFSGSANSNMLNFQGSKGSCHGNQIWAKIRQNCTYFSSVRHRDTFCILGHSVYGTADTLLDCMISLDLQTQ